MVVICSNMQGVETPDYFTPRVGEYDMWAIKYGYMTVEGEDVLDEHEVSVAGRLPRGLFEEGGGGYSVCA